MLVDPAIERFPEGMLSTDRAEQLDLGRSQLERGRRDVDSGGLGRNHDLGHRCPRIGEDVGNGALDDSQVDPEPHGQVRLGIHVDAQDPVALLCERPAQVDRSRRLADATLLIRNRDHIRHGHLLDVLVGRSRDAESVRRWYSTIRVARDGVFHIAAQLFTNSVDSPGRRSRLDWAGYDDIRCTSRELSVRKDTRKQRESGR